MSDFPYMPQSDAERQEMLSRIGVRSIDELLDKAMGGVPRCNALPIPKGLSELEVEPILEGLSAENPAASMKVFAGAGAYDMYVPAVVDEISARPEFYTAYTPYQAEASQGTLTAIFEFQSIIAGLLRMDIANASMYDGASATAEAAVLAIHHTRRRKVLYSQALHPLYVEVIRTYLQGFGVEFVPVPILGGTTDVEALRRLVDENTACFILQNPNFFGIVEDGPAFADVVHAVGALYVVCVADPMSLGVLAPPGDYGADVVAGEGQQFGNYLSFGGPYLGFFAARSQFLRAMPGRIVGMTKDVEGRRGFVMVFQTREQHIRRARATSNICTNQQLCALRATVYLALLGKDGFRRLSKLLFDRAHYLAQRLSQIDGVSLLFQKPFFREFAIKLPKRAGVLVEELVRRGIIPGVDVGRLIPAMDDVLLVAASDKYDKSDMDELCDALAEAL